MERVDGHILYCSSPAEDVVSNRRRWPLALAVCYYVWGGLVLSIAFAGWLMEGITSRVDLLSLSLTIAYGILCVISGRCIHTCRAWWFSLGLGVLTSVLFPLGTILGFLTIVTLFGSGASAHRNN